MLSASSSFISTNWPELTLSTSFLGKGSAAGDRMSAVVSAGCCGAPAGLVTAGGIAVTCMDTVVGTARCCGSSAVAGVVLWPLVASGTEVSSCGGGRVPRTAKVD